MRQRLPSVKRKGSCYEENFQSWIFSIRSISRLTLPTPEMIYEGDTQAVEACDIFIADLTNEDAGVMVELGIAIKSDTKIIIGINSDIRLQSANCYAVPTMGMNHYVLGAILKHGYFVRSFAEAVEKLKELLKEA